MLRFEKVKVRCKQCGVRGEKLGFLDKSSRQTADGEVIVELAHQVSELCKVMAIEDVATFEHLHFGGEVTVFGGEVTVGVFKPYPYPLHHNPG